MLFPAELPQGDVDFLLDEIGRYLAAVDAFREEACEPRWRVGSPPPRRDEARVAGSRTVRPRQTYR